MKVYISTILILYGAIFFQNSGLKLEYITDAPIKIDGGCSFYTYRDTSLFSGKTIFLVDASQKKLALIKLNGQYKFLYLKNRRLRPDGYVDTYSGDSYSAVLDVKKQRKLASGMEFAGTLTIQNPKSKGTIAVHGNNEEFDFNH